MLNQLRRSKSSTLPVSAILGVVVVALLFMDGANVVTSRIDSRSPGTSRGLSVIPPDRASLVYWSTYIFLARVDRFEDTGPIPGQPRSRPRNYYGATVTETIKGEMPAEIRIGQEGGGSLAEGDHKLKTGAEYLIMAGNTAEFGFYQILVPGGNAQIEIVNLEQRAGLIDEFRRLANAPEPTSVASPIAVTEVVAPGDTETPTSEPTVTNTPTSSATMTEIPDGSPEASPVDVMEPTATVD